MKLIIILMILLFSSPLLAEKITMYNTSNITKTVYMQWINHPYGCYSTQFGIKCDFNKAVAEIKPQAKFDMDASIGDKYCAKWENTAYHLRTEDSATEQCFKIEEDTDILVTPNSVFKRKNL